MRRIFVSILFFLFAFYFLLSKPASAHDIEINTTKELDEQVYETVNNSIAGEQIKNFNTDIHLLKDGSMEVIETIDYFFDTPRHGIYRNIPYTLRDGYKRYDMEFKFEDITDEKGKKYNADKSKSGEQWVIKIGDPNKTISGDHTYIISYTVKGALRYFEDHDELYWNATGTQWTVPIVKATASVTLPEKVKDTDIKMVCYTGAYDSTDKKCDTWTDGTTTGYETTLYLNSYQGMTIVDGFPKGIIEVLKPIEFVPFFDRWYGKIALFGIIMAAILWYLVLPIYLVIKWFQKGRDPEVGIAVTATFDPPKIGKRDLSPAESGALLDETVDKRDLFATIVDLARRGYIKIREPKEKEFHLDRTTPKSKRNVIPGLTRDPGLLPFEQTLLDGIFSGATTVKLKEVKFYTTALEVETELYKLMVTHKYFVKNPRTTRNLYYGLGAVGLVTGNFVLFLIALIFGRVMPAKTIHGAHTAKKAEGLKNFLKSQERQMNFQGNKQMLFEKLLPYAVAFGVEKAWAKRFEGMDLKNPDWYEGTSSTHFNTIIFANSLSNSYSNFAVSSTPPSSSSSSGFSGGSSGGGGGGGGGGSW